MKKMIILIAAGVFFAALTTGCGNNAKPRLYIYNWTYYIPDEVIKGFEKQFNAKVIYDMYASNEEMFAKLKAGGGGYDLVFPSGDYVAIMIREGMLEPISHEKIPNFVHIDSMVLGKIRFDEGCRFSVPFMMGAAGISVNTAKIPDAEPSWRLFERNDLRGRLTLLDDMREVLGAALRTRGYSVNTVDTGQLTEAKQVVMGWRKNIVKFDAEAFGKGFASGEFWAVHGYAENVFLELDSADAATSTFFIPREGACAYLDNMVILKKAKNRDLACRFINYIHEPSVHALIVDFLRLPSINVSARSFTKRPPHYTIADLANTELKEDLGEHLERYNAIWQEIRIGR